MSASEKLGELLQEADGPQTYCPEPQEWEDAAGDVMSALPQIVAVVEAANTAAASLHLEKHVGDVFRLSSALRALDEALS